MTKQELIDHLEHLAEYVKYSEDAPALREVIEMLKCSEMPNDWKKRTQKRTETHACDLIDRREAIEALYHVDEYNGRSVEAIRNLPSAQPEIVRCHKCIHWNRDTIRQNSNDAGWWNEAICERHSNEIWTSWKDADWYCADAERREE